MFATRSAKGKKSKRKRAAEDEADASPSSAAGGGDELDVAALLNARDKRRLNTFSVRPTWFSAWRAAWRSRFGWRWRPDGRRQEGQERGGESACRVGARGRAAAVRGRRHLRVADRHGEGPVRLGGQGRRRIVTAELTRPPSVW